MFDWNDYLKLAEDLFANKLDLGTYGKEVRLRNSVSRAYYSAFCQARNFCEQKKLFSPRGIADDHGDLIDQCLNHGNFDMKDIGKHLQWLRNRRNECDYVNNLDESQFCKNLQMTADQAIDRAHDIIRGLRALESQI